MCRLLVPFILVPLSVFHLCLLGSTFIYWNIQFVKRNLEILYYASCQPHVNYINLYDYVIFVAFNIFISCETTLASLSWWI